MKSRYFLIILLMIIILFVGGKALLSVFGKPDHVQQVVEDKYTNDQGLIHAYPLQDDSQYLSESIGLYMQYLVLVNDKTRFEEQYDYLATYFMTQKADLSYLKWLLDDKTTVNALIDDLRIITSLQEASSLFAEPKYEDFAQDILKTITSTQNPDGIYVDFYDWSFELPASRITLSYLTPAFSKLVPDIDESAELLKALDQSPAFFPEYYDTKEKAYIKSDEVHMIDQLLIALNRANIGEDSDVFKSWVIEEWEEKGHIYGKYDRQSQSATVTYESLSVYAYLHDYFLTIDKQDLAKEVINRTQEIADETVLDKAHFFDYIHYRMMLLSIEKDEK